MQKTSKTTGGIGVEWGATHRDGNGRIISRQLSIEPPVLTCLRLSCLLRYLRAALFYALLSKYHAKRVGYAEARRHRDIPERYRTGEPAPQTMWQAILANIHLIYLGG